MDPLSAGASSDPERFDRQMRFAPLGPGGQARLESRSALVVGCGATGGVLAQGLARAGIGRLVLVDRDVVERSNLPRQVLFEERHAARGVHKVEAAAETLARVGGPTRLLTHAAHLDGENVAELAEGADLILDGTDNLATRYLLNDYSVRSGVPWIYAGVVGAGGLVLPVLPGRGACLRCVFPDPPPPGALPTCDTAGVLLPAVGAVASLQTGLALRLLAAPEPDAAGIEPALIQVDVWSGEVSRLDAPRDPGCPCCGRGELPFLERADRAPVVLCGRNTVQVQGTGARPDLDELARRLTPAGAVRRVGPLLRFAAEDFRITLFPDGRALVEGTDDPGRARALYDRFVGA